ncbi:electron transport complex protein RnfG [Novimethylophilus kurashikiensis]|uniref:Ion-translocating oxidoreductase complex subunit G n=1 Tax=Novimethylophilus kurashikiensis TaxID=1825523 RepID=A0A2R5F6D0_9PROT|nr:FMN-binding protein [Novimethylophilus kurashikiensis]GBG13138.1 electron transport complex protein RnfG [Novimethylophilus kurashikiensis]
MTEQTQAAPVFTSTASMIRALGLIATICGVIIVGVYESTLTPVAANKKLALERQVFKVLPGAKHVTEYFATASGITPTEGHTVPADAVRFYAVYGADKKLAGIAAEGSSAGYADQVRVLYGYDVTKQAIVGIGVVSMRETPGIGDKILTDEDFLKNFKELDVRLAGDMQALANAVKTVKHGTKKNAWEIDAISGATVTSKAVGRGINQSAQALLPKLVPHIDQLRSQP